MAAMLAPFSLVVLAVVCGVLLLLAFQEVVGSSMRRGEDRNLANAAHTEALLRCSYTQDLGQRKRCYAQLNTAPAVPAESKADAALLVSGESTKP